jgi:hypothetical protein
VATARFSSYEVIENGEIFGESGPLSRIFPHWLNGATGKTIPFSRKDDGGDLVESSFLFQGLLTARQYFNADNEMEKELRNRISWLWNEAEWDWYTRDGRDQLYGTGVPTMAGL